MNFIFLGPPGAGKGSLAVKVAEDYKIPHISTGDIFRANIKNQTPLGLKVKAIIDSGSLVSDDLTCELVKDRISKDDCKNGFILDGFPRTIPQAEMFVSICPEVAVVNFQAEGVCDKCGGEIYQRDDDKQESILHRMEVYREQTEPLIKFYTEMGKIYNFDSAIETNELLKEFKKVFPVEK